MNKNLADEIKVSVPSSRYLVYTSAGDRANLNCWLNGKKQFDLWVTYYGDCDLRHKNIADFYNIHKGSKWQNLRYIYHQWPKILSHYEAIFVMDDDIIISSKQISRLFTIREHYDLWICQPSFDPRGIVTHAITRVKPGNFLRYTNFIENTCPLFRRDKLDMFMDVYDSSLPGNGVDYWYLDVLGSDLKERLAVIDAIPCVNPHARTKGGIREYDKIDKLEWKQTAEQLGSRYGIKCHLFPHEEFRSIPNTSIRDHLTAFYYWILLNLQRYARYLKRFFIAHLTAFFYATRPGINIRENFRALKYFIRRQKPITMILGPVFKRSTRKIEIDITYSCNLKCPSCNRSCTQAPTAEEMTVEQIRKFVEESIKSNVRWESMRLLGGEPTLHAGLSDIINILLDYKKEHSPDLTITLVTNGSGIVAREAFKKIPKAIVIENSEKRIKGYEHIDFNDAPADHFWNAFVDYSNACWIPYTCGTGFTPYGYYCCSIAGAMDRVFGFNMGRKTLPSDNDFMVEQLRVFCRLCEHFFGECRFGRVKTSISWQKAYAQYKVEKPHLPLY